MHSPKFEMVKQLYNEGRWGKERVRNAVLKGWITAEEYTEITGDPFEA